MKLFISLWFVVLVSIQISFAQFTDKGEIMYEVKTNIKKTLGSSNWAEGMKDKLPTFKSTYFKLKFSGNKTQFVFDHNDDKDKLPPFMRQNDEKSQWIQDFEKGVYMSAREIFGTLFVIQDSIRKINWRLSNENRVIAGFNCRKATGVIMDSVYVFAFYTDEIITPGGPCTVNGLPGMILGMTIPRLYTSWIATEVKPMTRDPLFTDDISNKKSYTRIAAIEAVKKSTKDWTDDSDPDSGKFIDQLIWNLIL